MKRNAICSSVASVLMAASACGKEAPPAAPPPPRSWSPSPSSATCPCHMELVGQTAGFQDVEIRARVEGFLDTVAFTEGRSSGRGSCSTRSTASRSQASLANAKANLATAQARLEKARTTSKRFTPLAAKQAVSQQELDNARRRRTPRRARWRPQGGRREGRARPRLHDDHLADRRPRRHDEGEGRQPGRPRREHAARHDLADRPDPLPRRHQPRPSTCGLPGASRSAGAGRRPAARRRRSS